ncbi:MAG: hypothetical protein LBT20_01475 [Clostridiales bacterium]|jgi:predicted secreted hydrolase|nr:hypothetical protein [Clostridiales bacterium]
MSSKIIRSGLGSSAEEFKSLGLEKTVKAWEDGFRTGGAVGTYEWWYFDAHLTDGTKLVIVFYTKRMMLPQKPLSPYATIDLDTADGRHLEERVELADISFSSSKDGCDIKIGDCYIRGDLHNYEIGFKNDVVEVKATLSANVPPWRPQTGHILFGEQSEEYFAWLPSVPEGSVTAEITLDGKVTRHEGSGYHDHNFGNVLMTKLMHHWYWGRAKVGEYQIIASYITGEKKYGYKTYPIFMLAKNGKILADDGEKLTYSEEEPFFEEATGKTVYNKLVYDFRDGKKGYRVTFSRQKTLINFKMIDQIKGIVKLAAKIIGFSGAYHRFFGGVTVEAFEDGVLKESVTGEAIWELMYFGKNIK